MTLVKSSTLWARGPGRHNCSARGVTETLLTTRPNAAEICRTCRATPVSDQKEPSRILSPKTYTKRVIDLFEQRSSEYDENDTLHPPLCAEVLRLANLEAGETVLDAACGTGTIALTAAELVGPTGMMESLRSRTSCYFQNIMLLLYTVCYATSWYGIVNQGCKANSRAQCFTLCRQNRWNRPFTTYAIKGRTVVSQTYC